jgi:hypothetical protein
MDNVDTTTTMIKHFHHKRMNISKLLFENIMPIALFENNISISDEIDRI